MTLNDGFDLMVSDWLDEVAEQRTPGYLDEILAETAGTRQRLAWSSPERWLPVETTFQVRLAPAPRGLWALVAVAALLVAVVLAAFSGASRPHLPTFGVQANGHIAFVDGSTLEFASADGTNVASILSIPTGVTAVQWSPDGKHLAYRESTGPSIVVVTADGKDAVTVATGASVGPWGSIAWSPDSRRLAFGGFSQLHAVVVLVDADGTNLAPIGGVPRTANLPNELKALPAWSPDGQWISFVAFEGSDSVGLYAVHPDGTWKQRLAGEQHLAGAPPSEYVAASWWAPDPSQSRLLYSVGGDVKVFDLATSTETTVAQGFWPTWSPDGTRISWWRDGTHIAHVEDLDAGIPRTVEPFPTFTGSCADHPELAGKAICAPAYWSPDGGWVYGQDVVGGSIVFAKVDGSEPTRMISLDTPLEPVDGLHHLPSISWQPIAP